MTPFAAKKILSLLSNTTVGELTRTDSLYAIKELIEATEGQAQNRPDDSPQLFNVFVYNDNVRRVEAIKTIRQITGWGLREAKNFSDIQPKDYFVGPVATMTQTQLDAIKCSVPFRADPI